MLLTVQARAYAGRLADQLRAAAADGFEAVELDSTLDGVPLVELGESQFSDLCGAAAEQGLVIATLGVGAVDALGEQTAGIARLAQLSLASGSRLRLLSSARPGVADRLHAQDDPPEMLFEREVELWRRAVTTIWDANPSALVMVESSPLGVCNTIGRQARLLDALDLPGLGFNWDFVNCWMAGEHPWPGPWELLRGRLYGVHYKAAKADPYNPRLYASQCLPGDDDIPHRSLWATWAAVGYDGPVTVEPQYQHFAAADRFAPEPPDPQREVCARVLERMLDYRRRAWERLY